MAEDRHRRVHHRHHRRAWWPGSSSRLDHCGCRIAAAHDRRLISPLAQVPPKEARGGVQAAAHWPSVAALGTLSGQFVLLGPQQACPSQGDSPGRPAPPCELRCLPPRAVCAVRH
eukprot:3336212-Rhodomonas_salina.1